MTRNRFFCCLWFLATTFILCQAQRPALYKMSPFVRQAAMERQWPTMLRSQGVRQRAFRDGSLTALVRADSEEVLRRYGCTPLSSYGDLFIASIPLSRLSAFSQDKAVRRIEAGPRASALMDSVRLQVDAMPVYAGQALPQAFDGSGVVLGVMDIGFDLTHPNFYSADMSRYRIKAMWDQLSTDTLLSTLPVGRDYVGQDALLAIGCPRDGYQQTHGTHTLGIAAGSGYDSPYKGMAPGADICLVCNATTDDINLIDSADYYKYTYAVDALGFKYIFDYAASQNKPCVINFSEGSYEDFMGYDQLYYALLDSMLGPGRIIVASAGNLGTQPQFFEKPAGKDRDGAFLASSSNSATLTLKSNKPFTLTTTVYADTPRQISFRTEDILAAADSTITDTLLVDSLYYVYQLTAYPSSYDSSDICYDVYFVAGSKPYGTTRRVSVSVSGAETDVQAFCYNGYFYAMPELDASLSGGEATHNIHSPGSAPNVICVGASAYRTQFVNSEGQTYTFDAGHDGHVATYSSRGPTYDGRVKPDVVAPGTNVISSYSSFYLEGDGDKPDKPSFISTFNYSGRTYLWASNAGTSMSSPVVAGAVALWLQACPTLTPQQVMEVIAHTSSHPDASLSYPNNDYGYGQIDVYKGLLYVLHTLGIDGISDHQPSGVSIVPRAGGADVTFSVPLRREASVAVYALNGQRLVSTSVAAGCEQTFVALPSSLCIIQVNGDSDRNSGSVIIRGK